jgi:hypothetical protein
MVDFGNVSDQTATLSWRRQAVKLAHERELVGQAWLVDDIDNHDVRYSCVSANEPTDYDLRFNLYAGTISCSCRAGQHLQPCSHAGAVLMLICHLAPERVRNPDGSERIG